jgi:hypothetical protein
MISPGYTPQLGQDLTDEITDVLPDAYSDTSTLTGLPIIWEIALGGVALFAIWSLTKKAGTAVHTRAKKTYRKLRSAL